jgi:IS30 family transposase
MIQRKRSRLSPTEKNDIWRRWKCGQSLHEIGLAHGRPHPTIRKLLLPSGGIPPIARRCSRLALTWQSERIFREGSLRDRAASTLSREIYRNGGRPAYRAHAADDHAWDSALRPKKCLLAFSRKLRNIVASKLILNWSPEQISGWLKIQFPDDASMRVSHETIYRSLFIQARGVLKKELMDHLRSKRRMRRSRHATISGQSRGQIVDAISIRERPAEVQDRAVPGHWEGDLLSGAKNSYIATLVERHSRFAMLIKVRSKETDVVVAALSRHVRKLPTTLKRSLTWDRGLEMAKHKEFTVATDVQVYFCDPQSPWQRGTNENTNLLLRQYFPRRTDLSGYSQEQLDQVSLLLNQRPRKTLGFQTPADKLQASVASTI